MTTNPEPLFLYQDLGHPGAAVGLALARMTPNGLFSIDARDPRNGRLIEPHSIAPAGDWDIPDRYLVQMAGEEVA